MERRRPRAQSKVNMDTMMKMDFTSIRIRTALREEISMIPMVYTSTTRGMTSLADTTMILSTTSRAKNTRRITTMHTMRL